MTAARVRPLARARASSTSCTCTSRSRPSLSLLALWAADGPDRRDLPHLRSCARGRCRRPTRCCGRRWRRSSAGSRSPRTPGAPSPTHIGGDAVVIPNGVYVDRFAAAAPRARVAGHRRRRRRSRSSAGSTSRARACRSCSPALPQVAGGAPRACGCSSPATATTRPPASGLPRSVAAACEFLGGVTDEDKAALLALGRRLRRAAHRRRELRHRAGRGDERRAPRCVASDLAAFSPGARRRRGRGAVRQRATPTTWPGTLLALLADPDRRAELAARGRRRAGQFDWSVVADRRAGRLRDGHPAARRAVSTTAEPTSMWHRLVRGGRTAAES